MQRSIQKQIGFIVSMFLLGSSASARADLLTYYNTLRAFQAVSTTSLEATFDALGNGYVYGTVTQGSVTFTPVVDATHGYLYIAGPGGAIIPTPTSKVLTQGSAAGEEFDLTFSGPAPTAVGFDVYTNNSTTTMISVYDTSNLLIGTYTLPQAPLSLGFVGVADPDAIGRIRFTAGYDTDHDSAIDNVLVGQQITAVPEPSSLLLIGGVSVFLLFDRWRRRRPEIR